MVILIDYLVNHSHIHKENNSIVLQYINALKWIIENKSHEDFHKFINIAIFDLLYKWEQNYEILGINPVLYQQLSQLLKMTDLKIDKEQVVGFLFHLSKLPSLVSIYVMVCEAIGTISDVILFLITKINNGMNTFFELYTYTIQAIILQNSNEKTSEECRIILEYCINEVAEDNVNNHAFFILINALFHSDFFVGNEHNLYKFIMYLCSQLFNTVFKFYFKGIDRSQYFLSRGMVDVVDIFNRIKSPEIRTRVQEQFNLIISANKPLEQIFSQLSAERLKNEILIKELAKQQEEFAKQQREQQEEFAKQQREQQEEFAKQQEELANQKREHQEELAKQKREQQEELAKQQREQQRELAKHQEELAKQQREHQEELAKQQEELANQKREHQEELAKQQREHQKELAKQQREHQEEFANQKKEQQREQQEEFAKQQREQQEEFAKQSMLPEIYELLHEVLVFDDITKENISNIGIYRNTRNQLLYYNNGIMLNILPHQEIPDFFIYRGGFIYYNKVVAENGACWEILCCSIYVI
jgi:hypothetical protein